MAGEDKSCENCTNLEVILNEKNFEIQRLKLQIKNLKAFLLAYEKQSKLCQICAVKDNVGEDNIDEKLDNINVQTQISPRKRLEEVHDINTTDSQNASNPIQIEKDIETETNNATLEDNSSSKPAEEILNSTSQSEIENSTDYVYDENLKMYFCPSVGYYYDHNTGYFYDAQTQTYYSYNFAKSEYELCDVPVSNKLEKEDCDSVLDKVNDLNINDNELSLSATKNNVQKANSLQNTFGFCEIQEKKSLENDTICGSTRDWLPAEGTNGTIEDMVRSVVDQSSGMSDYVYDEKNEMYYSKSTGYYYDPVKKLLYDPQSKVYYLYIEETMSYEFYCKADEPSSMSLLPRHDPLKGSHKKKSKKQWRKKVFSSEQDDNLNEKDLLVLDKDSIEEDKSVESPEEGEIFSSTDSDSDSEQSRETTPFRGPPCIRAIVKKSDKLKIGTLILVTCTGAIIGRDKINSVYVPDIGISKVHAEIKFSNDSWKYSIEDLGSQNGTFVNNIRLSEPKQKSEPLSLNHGDILTLGSCELLLHMHEGHDTCDKCEPGQVIAEISFQEALAKPAVVFMTKEEKEKERRQELSRMKKKYGLKGMEYVNSKKSLSPAAGYEDKAEMRRKTVGSQNPYEKTETASMAEGISKSNKGFQMLKKLGWKEGDALGLKGSGISEPIPLRPWLSKAGLGSSESEATTAPLPKNSRQQRWVKAQERYLKLS